MARALLRRWSVAGVGMLPLPAAPGLHTRAMVRTAAQPRVSARRSLRCPSGHARGRYLGAHGRLRSPRPLVSLR
ncbi:hypothetical protein T492DRAFT_1095536 [Pavlovales sp. CCMP2436]|nr:hypothetical protein T492DRAFT_1095536 [Pavlovales sp. CCMP2436]